MISAPPRVVMKVSVLTQVSRSIPNAYTAVLSLSLPPHPCCEAFIAQECVEPLGGTVCKSRERRASSFWVVPLYMTLPRANQSPTEGKAFVQDHPAFPASCLVTSNLADPAASHSVPNHNFNASTTLLRYDGILCLCVNYSRHISGRCFT